MKLIEELDKLDRAFDLLLVFLSIITAAVFQLGCTIEPLEISQELTQSEFFQEVTRALLTSFRILFIPLALLIVFWIINRIFLRARIRLRKTFSEFCYLFAFAILLVDISALIGLSFYPYDYPRITLTLAMLTMPQFLGSLGVVYSYEILFIYRENIRTRKETVKRIWVPILVRASIIWYIAFVLNWAIFYVSLFA